MAELVDSNQKKLSMQEIVDISVQNSKEQYTKEQVLGAIYKELTLPGSAVIQLGNSLFLVHRSKTDPTIGIMRALNADLGQNYLESCEKFAGMMYNEYKVDTIVSDYTDPTLNNIFAYVGRNKPAGMGYKIEKLADGKTFRATAKLGPEL
jgi:hypothetical protein